MIRRKTQDPAYWNTEFTVAADDLQYLSTMLIDDELPRSAEELSRALIVHHCRQEEQLIEHILSTGVSYQPKKSYEVGDRVIFAHLGYATAEVVGIRDGRNPQYGAFRVIRVSFEDGDVREFAAELESDHPLNADQADKAVGGEPARSIDEIVDEHVDHVAQLIEGRLELEPSFVRLAGRWFRRDLLVEVHVGHLNLAEAVLDMAGGGPLPTEELLGDLELPEEINPKLRIFSLNYVLQEDDRFDEVGPAGEVLWFLSRMEPEHVRTIPMTLHYTSTDYDRALLSSEMIALERRLDDEWSDMEATGEPSDSAMIVLTYPHLWAGTLPYASSVSEIFPTGRTERIRFEFIDGETRERMPGWVVREARYVYGLRDWYETHGVRAGAYLDLRRGEEPGTVIIERHGRSPRREWVRIALFRGDEVSFEMRKELIACKYDELMIVTVDDLQAQEKQWRRKLKQMPSVGTLVADVFSQLAKLSPQGSVHASTLYSAINVMHRTPPGPLFAELAANPRYAPVGDNYWVLSPSTGTGESR